MLSPSVFTDVINSYLPEPQSSLVNGIIFGIDIKATKSFYQQLKIVGLLHIVVLSGMNINLLSTTVFQTINQYFSRSISTLITILIIIFFIIFVGPKAPIIRAGFMSILTLVAVVFGRKSYPLYSLFLSLVFIAIFFPSWLKTISLKLSYAATLGLILFGNFKIKDAENFFEEVKNIFKKEFFTSLSAQTFTAPLIFLYFKEISLISPVSNILAAPVIVPIMIFGFLTAILGKINFYLGILPAWICYLFACYLVFITQILSKIPFAYLKF